MPNPPTTPTTDEELARAGSDLFVDAERRTLEIAADLEPIESATRQLLNKLGAGVYFATAVASPFDALDAVEEISAEGMTLETSARRGQSSCRRNRRVCSEIP